jgi:glycosyltransferase involved in cell wall biosynthesis
MDVLITAVGHRTEHWTDLFAILASRPGLRTTVVVSDVTEMTIAGLDRVVASSSSFTYHRLPHRMGESRTGHMASITFRPSALRRLRVHRPDVMHIIGEPAYLSTFQLRRLRDRRWPGTPITHYAAQNVVTNFPIPFPWLERRAYRSIDHMLPITPAAQHVLATKGYRGRTTIVPLGVDSTIFTPTRHNGTPISASPDGQRRFTVGFVGRLERHKGVESLIEVTSALDCNLLIVGRGSLEDRVRQASRERPGKVELHDWVDHANLPDLLRQMNALILPSQGIVQRNVVPWVAIPLREQFGRVLIEAMACGVPVIGTDVGEISHVIGPAGLVVPPDDPIALADSLAKIRDTPGLAAELREHGIARAARMFSWERIADQLQSVWADVHGRSTVARQRLEQA